MEMAALAKTRTFQWVRFPPAVYREAIDVSRKLWRAEWDTAVAAVAANEPGYYLDPPADASGAPTEDVLSFYQLQVSQGDTVWTLDSITDFFSELTQSFDRSNLGVAGRGMIGAKHLGLEVHDEGWATTVTVSYPDRSLVQAVFEPFESWASANPGQAPYAELDADTVQPRIFIGHGGASKDWLELQNDLHNIHGLEVESFESGERAGHALRSILESFVEQNNFAILVHSKEDEQADHEMRARQNVVHEAGLFQGKLGFDKVVILVEKGTALYSNLDGIIHIEYDTGKVLGSVGRILGVIKREFTRPQPNGGR